MKKKTTNGNSDLSRSQEDQGLGQLVAEVRGLIQSARHAAATTVNTLQVLTNFEIGRRIIEHEQKGAKRAEYGKELLKELSVRLSDEFGKGFSLTNLKLMRQFCIEYRDRIGQSPSDQLSLQQIGQQATDQSQTSRKSSGQLPPRQLYLPSKEVLRQKLLDWVREQEAGV